MKPSKLIACFLVLCMLVGMMPTKAFAASPDLPDGEDPGIVEIQEDTKQQDQELDDSEEPEGGAIPDNGNKEDEGKLNESKTPDGGSGYGDGQQPAEGGEEKDLAPGKEEIPADEKDGAPASDEEADDDKKQDAQPNSTPSDKESSPPSEDGEGNPADNEEETPPADNDEGDPPADGEEAEPPAEGSIKSDELLANASLPIPEGYEDQGNGVYTKTVEEVTDIFNYGKKVGQTVKTTVYTYTVTEVYENGKLAGYEGETVITTDYVTTTHKSEIVHAAESLPSETSSDKKEFTEDAFPFELKEGVTGTSLRDVGSLASHWQLKEGFDGTFKVNAVKDKNNKYYPLSITLTRTVKEIEGNVTVEKQIQQIFSINTSIVGYGENMTHSLNGWYYGGGTINTKTTTESDEITTNSDPDRVSNKDTFVIYQDEDGKIHFKTPVSNNSSVDLTPLEPDIGTDGLWGKGFVTSSNRPGEIPEIDSDILFQYLGGNSLRSAVIIDDVDCKDMNLTYIPQYAQLYILRDENGIAFPVYCVDKKIEAYEGQRYELGNIEDSKKLNPESAAQLKAAALNGYWGRTEGFGSLENVKTLLLAGIESGEITGITPEQVAELSDGVALAATQAALWYLSDPTVVDKDDPFNNDYTLNPPGTGMAVAPFLLQQLPVGEAYFQYLISKAAIPEGSKPDTDIIKGSDLKEVNITVVDVLEAADEDKAAIYKADVSFVLEVEPDRMNSDNLIVTLYDAKTNEQIGAQYKLVDARNDDGKTYTIREISLPNGSTISLRLTGTQNVEQSAYLIMAEGGYDIAQPQVGIMSGKYNVDLEMQVDFLINDISVKEEPLPPTPDPDDNEDPNPNPNPNPDDNENQDPSPKPGGDENQPPTPQPDDDENQQNPPPVPTPTPDEDDDDDDDRDPVVVIPDPDPPRNETPPATTNPPSTTNPPPVETPPETVNIPEEPEVPKEQNPTKETTSDEDDPSKHLHDADVHDPNADKNLVDLYDSDIPMLNVPKTSDDSGLWLLMAMLAAAGILWLLYSRRNAGVAMGTGEAYRLPNPCVPHSETSVSSYSENKEDQQSDT